jgi:type IV secretory pathway TrbL component
MERIVDVETGEILRLVEADGDGWRAVESDMDAIARAVGTAGAGARQRAKHQEERAGFERAIARARAGTTPENAR